MISTKKTEEEEERMMVVEDTDVPRMATEKVSDVSFDIRKRVFSQIGSFDYKKAQDASLNERKRTKLPSYTLTYGEIPVDSLALILMRIIWIRASDESSLKKKTCPLDLATFSESDAFRDDVFVDLGSGAGRPVLAASCLFEFKEARGVEILKDLHTLATKAKEDYAHLLKLWGSKLSLTQRVHFYHGSIFDSKVTDWAGEGTVIVCNSTCFSDEMFERIADCCKGRIRKDAVFVTFTARLDSKEFDVLFAEEIKMSWGLVDVFYHRVKNGIS